ncbi:MAG: hypothetical protein CFE26_15240 [Verrucomicrobiales bacterium VVV1]|nr:MAG: hypothetical protein CFE26_15240 [Verrucomicrobiales bacterium VVV1]
MPDYIVCTRAIKGGSFSSEPGPTRLHTVLKLSNVKRIGVAPRTGRVGLPENAPGKAVGVDSGGFAKSFARKSSISKIQPFPTCLKN